MAGRKYSAGGTGILPADMASSDGGGGTDGGRSEGGGKPGGSREGGEVDGGGIEAGLLWSTEGCGIIGLAGDPVPTATLPSALPMSCAL